MMAKRRRGRPVNGILVLDKPAQQSSNRALQTAKHAYFAQKAGHTGSLDPLATGVLPVCFGEATKFSQFLLDSDKAYCSTFKLGVITASGDADGDVLEERDADAVTAEDVKQALRGFEGEIEQLPSMFSALKHQGQPLYKLARQGVEVERQPRRVTVHELVMEGFRSAGETGDKPEVDVMIRCSKGTYVRSIAEDLGQVLGCGAHVIALRRIAAGPFDESRAVSLETLETLKQGEEFAAMDALLLPVDIAVQQFPAVKLVESSSFYVRQGQPVFVPNAPTEGLVRIYADTDEFMGMGEVLDDGRIGPKRLVVSS